MELQHTTRSVGSLESVFDQKFEQPVDGDITLPEYCPDILRVLKTTIEPSVYSVQVASERATIEGSSRVIVLYTAEDGTLQSFEQSYPFSRSVDIPGLEEGAAVCATVKTEFANGRAVSQRRLDVHGMLGCRVQAKRKREDAVLTGVSGGGIQTLNDTIKVSSLEALQTTTFSLNEVIEIDPGSPAVDQVVMRQAVVVPSEVKAIKNKLLVKGNLETRVAYRSRGTAEPVQVLHVMPLSQIIEAPGVSEATENTLRLRVNSLEVTPKADTNGAARLLEIAARIGADVRGYAPVDLAVVKDAYSTQGGVSPEMRRLETRRLAESFRESFLAKESFDFGQQGIERVLLLSHEVMPIETIVKSDGLNVAGKVKYHVVFVDGDGNLAITDKELSYSHRCALKGEETLAADVEIELLSVQESVSAGHLELRAELVAYGEVFAAEHRSVVGAVAENIEDSIAQRAPLTIYFASDGEPLWEIAKRYRTTMDAVRQENELASDVATSGQMLLIPSV